MSAENVDYRQYDDVKGGDIGGTTWYISASIGIQNDKILYIVMTMLELSQK